MSGLSSSAQLSRVQAVLTYFGSDGKLIEYAVPLSDDIAVTQVVKLNGRLDLRQESAATKNSDDIIARLRECFACSTSIHRQQGSTC